MSPLFYLGLIPTLSLLVIHVLWISDRRNTPDHNVTPHVVGVVIVLLVFGGAGAWQLVASLRGDADDHKPPMQEMQTIEASLAMKKTKVTQPQKPHEEPPPPVKKEGVSNDENKKPDPKPVDKKDD